MLVKIEARILIFPGTDFHFPSTSVPPGTFLGSSRKYRSTAAAAGRRSSTALSSKCEQCHVVSLYRKLNTDFSQTNS